MKSELLVCSSCGAKNSPARMACLHCNTNLRSSDLSTPDGSNQVAERSNGMNSTKWWIACVVGLIAVAVGYHFIVTVPNFERATIAAERGNQERLAKEAKIRAEEANTEKARADAAWLAEREFRKKQETAQAQAQIERDLRTAEERKIEHDERRAIEVKARLLQNSLSSCLGTADRAYTDRWNEHCSRLGQAPHCALPGPPASQYDLVRRQSRDECYTRFATFK